VRAKDGLERRITQLQRLADVYREASESSGTRVTELEAALEGVEATLAEAETAKVGRHEGG
jgi:hypothetical protein